MRARLDELFPKNGRGKILQRNLEGTTFAKWSKLASPLTSHVENTFLLIDVLKDLDFCDSLPKYPSLQAILLQSNYENRIRLIDGHSTKYLRHPPQNHQGHGRQEETEQVPQTRGGQGDDRTTKYNVWSWAGFQTRKRMLVGGAGRGGMNSKEV